MADVLTKTEIGLVRSIITEIQIKGIDGIFTAVWDTGATSTAMDLELAKKLGFVPYDMCKQYTANGDRMAGVYMADLILPNDIVFPDLQINDGILCDIDFLIGMDVITQGDFAITNVGGSTTMSFRRPSIETINYCLKGNKKHIDQKSVYSCCSDKKGKNCRGKKK